MSRDRGQCFVAMGLLVGCLVLGQAGPGFSLTEAPAAALVLAAGPTKHVIKSGETVSLLAQRYGVPAAAILKANPGLNPSRLQLGREILIPAGSQASPAAAAPVPMPAASSDKTIELRPEKAPQATVPLTSKLRERDLVDTSMKPTLPKSAPATPSVQDSQPAPAPAPQTAEPAQPQTGPSAKAIAETTSPTATISGSEPATELPSGPPLRGPEAAGLALVLVVLLGVLWALRGVVDNLTAGWGIRLMGLVRAGDVLRVAGCTGRVERLGGLSVTVRTVEDERLRVPNTLITRDVLIVLPPADEGE
ncbi:MAG: LysM peptidoglycan-binding domain-containing protein [Desulfovibrionaceae bacterium]